LSVTCDRSVVLSRYSTNKTGRHNITEILLKVALNSINQSIIFFKDILCGLISCHLIHLMIDIKKNIIRVITKLPNTEQSSKGKGKTHKSTNRQNPSTTGKLGKPQWPWLGTGISKEMVGWIRFYGTKPPAHKRFLKSWSMPWFIQNTCTFPYFLFNWFINIYDAVSLQKFQYLYFIVLI